LAEIYECISWENGFRDWNTFKAYLEKNNQQYLIEDFLKILLRIRDYAFDHSMRNLLIKETHITTDMLASLIKSLGNILGPVTGWVEKRNEMLENNQISQAATEIAIPLIINNWKGTNESPVGNVFFKDMKNFYNRLKQIKSKEGVCWACGVTSDDEGYPFNLLFLPVNKDLKSLNHRTQSLNDRLYLCVECAFHYMTEFNLFSPQRNREDAMFQAAQVIFHHSGYLPERLSLDLAEKVLAEAKASLKKK
jgi:hypothetical protein